MLIKDTEKLAVHAERAKRAAYYDRMRQWEEDKINNAIYVTDDELNPGNWELQKGLQLTTEMFEKKLLKIFPNARFATFPRKPDKRCVYRWLPDGTAQHLCTYENGLMPEHSVLLVKHEDIMDIDPNREGLLHLDRAALPKHEWDGTKWVFDKNEVPAGHKRMKTATRELTRGWRTVLVKLLEARVITLYEAEREFGIPNDKKWAFHAGKLDLNSPF